MLIWDEEIYRHQLYKRDLIVCPVWPRNYRAKPTSSLRSSRFPIWRRQERIPNLVPRILFYPSLRVGERTWERGLRRHIGKREDPADEVAREANCEAARGMSL